MPGKKSHFAEQCFSGNFIGADIGINEYLTLNLPEAWREFNSKFIPRFLEKNPDFSKIGAGLACGSLNWKTIRESAGHSQLYLQSNFSVIKSISNY
ncbi:MAG: hypothetical protein ABFC24_09060 [Methanoregulaceae archaeon]